MTSFIQVRKPYCRVLEYNFLIIFFIASLLGLIIFLPCYYKVWEVDTDSQNAYTKGTCVISDYTLEDIYRCDVGDCSCDDCGNRINCDYAKDVEQISASCCGDSCCARKEKRCVSIGNQKVCNYVCVETVVETCQTFCGNDTRYTISLFLEERNMSIVLRHYCNFDNYDCKNEWEDRISHEVIDCYYDSRNDVISEVSFDSSFHRRTGVYAGFVFASLFWIIAIVSIIIFVYKIDFGFTTERIMRKTDVEIYKNQNKEVELEPTPIN